MKQKDVNDMSYNDLYTFYEENKGKILQVEEWEDKYDKLENRLDFSYVDIYVKK